MKAIFATLFTACGVLGCGTATSPTANPGVKRGLWAGEHIIMNVGATSAEIEFDCGRATLPGTINADRDGAFTATGNFRQEGPGASPPGEPAQFPMRVSGTVKRDDMQASFFLGNNNEPFGSFALIFGGTARLMKCK